MPRRWDDGKPFWYTPSVVWDEKVAGGANHRKWHANQIILRPRWGGGTAPLQRLD